VLHSILRFNFVHYITFCWPSCFCVFLWRCFVVLVVILSSKNTISCSLYLWDYQYTNIFISNLFVCFWVFCICRINVVIVLLWLHFIVSDDHQFVGVYYEFISFHCVYLCSRGIGSVLWLSISLFLSYCNSCCCLCYRTCRTIVA